MKKMRKILICLMAMVMLLGASMTVCAATTTQVKAINAIKIQQDGKNKSSITLYSNGSTTAQPKEATLNVVCDVKGTEGNVEVKATPSNRAIVQASITKVNSSTNTATLTLTAVGNGKATVTVADKNNAKKAKKITVTVKTLANGISFGNNVVDNKIELAKSKGSTLNLGAAVNSGASNTKLKYTVEKVGNKANAYISCDAKGNVKIKKDASVSNEPIGTIVVTTADKAEARVAVYAKSEEVTDISLVYDLQRKKTTTSEDEAKGIGYGNLNFYNKKYVLNLKGNKGTRNNTYQLLCNAGAKNTMSNLVFSSNKESIATVDKNGKITAVGNGKATITISPKLGNNKKVTVTVNVDTDAEYVNVAKAKFEIIANNKATAQINATTNANAKTKNITYAVTGVKVGDVDYTIASKKLVGNGAANGDKLANYVSVTAKGVVKAKKVCTATITATAKDTSNNASATVTVNAINPVTKLTMKADCDSANKTEKNGAATKATVYKTGANEQTKLKLSVDGTYADNTTGNPSVTWKSAKESVAKVDGEGNVTVVGNGTSKITATAADGSGKTASITVTGYVKAYEINSAAKMASNGDGAFTINVKENTTYKLDSIIKASVNATAKTKGVNYYIGSDSKASTQVEIKNADVTIKAQPKDKNSQETVKTFILHPMADPDKAIAVVCDNQNVDSIALYAGNTATLAATTEGDLVLSDAVWKSADTKVATVSNGVVTAKKAGTTTITVNRKGGNESNAGIITVYVGSKSADVQKTINAAFTSKLNEENRDYTGIKATFTSKTNAIKMNILNPGQDIKDHESLGKTGIIVAIEEVANNCARNNNVAIDTVTIKDKTNAKTYAISRNGIDGNVTVSEDGNVIAEDMKITEALAVVLTSHDRTRLQDLNGISYDITFSLHYVGVPTLTYDFTYAADVAMDSAIYDTVVDGRIKKGVDLFNGRTEGAYAGIGTVDYNAGSNEFDITLDDITVSIDDVKNDVTSRLDATLDELADELLKEFGEEVKSDDAKDALSDVQEITLAIKGINGNTSTVHTQSKDDHVTREGLRELLKKYFNKATEGSDNDKATLANLDGSTAAATVTYKVGNMNYVLSYKLNFRIGESAFDTLVDNKIKEKIDEKRASIDAKELIVDYDSDHNKLTVGIKNKDHSIDGEKYFDYYDNDMSFIMEGLDHRYSGDIEEIFGTMLGIGSGYEDKVAGTQAVFNGKTGLADSKGNTNLVNIYQDGDTAIGLGRKLMNAFSSGDVLLREMNESKATVKVTYKAGDIQKTLLYTIEFVIDGADIHADSPAAQSDLDSDDILEDEVIDEETDEVIEEETAADDETDETIKDEVNEDETDEAIDNEADDASAEDETNVASEDETIETSEEVSDTPVVEEAEINTIEE